MTQKLLNDREIGQLIGMSAGWVRKQRHDRKYGRPHLFPLDPVFIGNSPRYREEEVNSWLSTLYRGIEHADD